MSHSGFDVDVVKALAVKGRIALTGLLAAIAFLTIGTAVSAAATLGVSATGSDTGDCESSPCLTVQYAIGQAASGDTINIGAGAFEGDVSVSTANLTIAGAGQDQTTLTGAGNRISILTGADGLVVTDLTTSGGARGLWSNGTTENVSFEDVTLTGHTSGGLRMLAPADAEDWTFNRVTATGNVSAGLRFTGSLTGLTITDSHLDGNDYGITTFAGEPPSAPGQVSDVTILNTTFENNSAKGLYFEILSDALIQGATVTGNGFAALPSAQLSGVDVNLKFADYSDIVFNDNVISDNGGFGFIVKGRDDGPYAPEPASVDGVTLANSVIDGNDGQVVIGNAVINVDVNGNRITGDLAGVGSYANVAPGSTVDAKNNWWGCNQGPGAAGCSTSEGTVDSSPYLRLSVAANQSAVAMGGATPVTATFNRNSAGETVTAPVMDGSTIVFGATGGLVGPASAPLTDGNAATTFTAANTPGPATVSASLGDVTAVTTVTVNGTVPTVSAPGLTGSGVVGQALTCTPGNATGGNPTPAVATVLLANGAAIPGQNGLSYTPVDADVGKSITCRSTATNSAGSVSQSSPGVTVTAVPVPPKPPVVTPIKPNVTVPSSGKVVITTIKCPEGSCQVTAPKTIKVKIGGKTYTATVKVQKNVPEGGSAKVTIVLPKKARKALKGKSGKAKLKITVTSTDGKKKTVNQTIKLKGKQG